MHDRGETTVRWKRKGKHEKELEEIKMVKQALHEVATGTVDARAVMDTDFKPIKITKEFGRGMVIRGSDGAFSGSDVRIAMGKFYTDDEWERKRKEVLSKPLP